MKKDLISQGSQIDRNYVHVFRFEKKKKIRNNFIIKMQ